MRKFANKLLSIRTTKCNSGVMAARLLEGDLDSSAITSMKRDAFLAEFNTISLDKLYFVDITEWVLSIAKAGLQQAKTVIRVIYDIPTGSVDVSTDNPRPIGAQSGSAKASSSDTVYDTWVFV